LSATLCAQERTWGHVLNNALNNTAKYGLALYLITNALQEQLGAVTLYQISKNAPEVPPALKEYIQQKLRNAGVKEWETLNIKQHALAEEGRMWCFHNTLMVAPSIVLLFERVNADPTNPEYQSTFDAIHSLLLHEAGHLRNHDSQHFIMIALAATVISFLASESIAYAVKNSYSLFSTPIHRQDWKITALKGLFVAFSANILFKWYLHRIEYRADDQIPDDVTLLKMFSEVLQALRTRYIAAYKDLGLSEDDAAKRVDSSFYSLWSSHPSCASRMTRLQKRIDALEAAYATA